MLITVQPDPNWQLSLAQLSPGLFFYLLVAAEGKRIKLTNLLHGAEFHLSNHKHLFSHVFIDLCFCEIRPLFAACYETVMSTIIVLIGQLNRIKFTACMQRTKNDNFAH